MERKRRNLKLIHENESESNEELVKADFFYKMALESYSLISKVNESLDTKIHNMLRIVSAIIPLTFGLAYFIINSLSLKIEILSFSAPLILIVSLASSLCLFVASLVIGVILYFPKKFEFIDAEKLINEYHDKSRLLILQRVSATIAFTVTTNNAVCDSKANALKWTQIFVVLGVIALVAAFIALIFTIQIIPKVTP